MVTDNISLSGVTTTYTFDSNGNLTGVNAAGTLTTMVYDKENRLKEHKQGAAANTRTFAYDLNSLKQSSTVSKVTDQLVWDGADMLGEVPAVKPVGAPLMPIRYNLAQGILFATTRFEPDPVRTDTGADFIGSILTDFDENGDYVAERRYKPYGELLAGTATTYGWTGNTGSRATLLQYAEQYNRRRHVSTKLKQWTTRDPLWPEESAYGYVRGGPLTAIDPSGKVYFKFPKPKQGKFDQDGRLALPPGESYAKNCCEALNNQLDLKWFYDRVRLKGRWDYKQKGWLFRDAGNFHYGFIGACLGLPLNLLLRAAGRAQVDSGNSIPDFGFGIRVHPYMSLPPYLSFPPYGDDPDDGVMIWLGFLNAGFWMPELKRKCFSPRMKDCHQAYKNDQDRWVDYYNSQLSNNFIAEP